MYTYMVVSMVRKTTLVLREDVYQALKARAGPRNMSKLINEILLDYFTKRKSMFGTMKKVDVRDLRDHRNRI